MATHRNRENRPDVPAELRASDDVIKKIRKLRWIGMEDEALALELASRRSTSTSPLLTGRLDTD